MKKLLLIISFIGFYSSAQKVSNITTRQEQSTIIVSYDLETKLPCKVSLYVSINGGTTWQGPLIKVTGDVGDKIISGNKNITWSVLDEFEEFKGDNIKFQVKALSNLIFNLPTVKIGNQEWTTKNLNVSTYRNGDAIPEVRNPKDWEKLTTGAWCYYNNDPKNGAIYGKLYNWYAINDPRGLAPEGYQIPSEYDWKTLIEFTNGGLSIDLKEIGRKHWKYKPFVAPKNKEFYINKKDYNEYDGLDLYNFTALPSGYRESSGIFQNIGLSTEWWSFSSFYSEKSNKKIYITMEMNDNSFYINNGEYGGRADFPAWNPGHKFGYAIWGTEYSPNLGLSIRCIKE